MDTQTVFTIIGAGAGIGSIMIAIAGYILNILNQKNSLELEKRLTLVIDEKFSRHKQEIDSKIESIESQLKTLNGRFDKMIYIFEHNEKITDKKIADLDVRVSELEHRE